MVALIVACEIGFWVFVVAGLVARYPLRRPRAGLVLLAMTPLVDVVLLVATAIDLRGGADATGAHSLAALYLGFSIGYGHRMITWADTRFAHRFAGGPAPVRLDGAAYARKCWRDVGLTGLSVAIAAAVLWGLRAIASSGADTSVFSGTYGLLGLILGIEVVSAVSYTLWPRKPRG
ncbi:hypothetical protein [Nocardioides daejeonensis]|uniref:hypothetical protein n=1 Tax=Nocardioides daejeonensis TaxID=1046556 RepID=UPI000D749381|nr:hypothetical protein [Nocardioides daejeonensis]